MRRTQHIIGTTCASIAIAITALQFAIAPTHALTSPPSLVISHVKITSSSGQFVTLYNASSTAIDTAKYQLVYFNNYDVSKATASKLVALSGVVPPHGYEIVTDATSQLCYQMTVMAASLGFSSTSGYIALQSISQGTAGGPLTVDTLDYIGWSKTTANGAQTLPASTSAFLARGPLDSLNTPIVTSPGDGVWTAVQPDTGVTCAYVAVGTGKSTAIYGALLAPTQPPTNYQSSELLANAQLVNEGLMSPVINELLPNPIGTGNDAVDEYIELYNPNSSVFDLAGYELRTGLTTQHVYIFPAGAQLAPQSFTAFYAATTNLSLSNTAGQVVLNDPNGAQVATSDPYDSAKDGYVWALGSSVWQWSTTATPAAINTITKPAVIARAKTKKSTSKTPSSTANLRSANSTSASQNASNSPSTNSDEKTPVHPGILALIALLALLYGAYEFRADLVNAIAKCRRYVAHRFANWRFVKRWRSSGASE